MQPIQVSLEGEFRLANALRAGIALKTKVSGGRTTLTIPYLRDYELLVFNQPGTPGVRK